MARKRKSISYKTLYKNLIDDMIICYRIRSW